MIWQGAQGDAAPAPLAVRNTVQGAKDQAHTIASRPCGCVRENHPQPSRLDVFSTPASSKSSHDALHRACGIFLAGAKNPFHQTVSI